MDSFEVKYDPDLWLPVPTDFPAADGASAEDWAAEQAVRQRARGFTETPESGTLDQYFLDVVEAARGCGEHGSFWASIAEDAPGFVAVTLDVVESSGPLDALLSALVARQSNEYEPASHSVTEAAGLGEGVCVHRLDCDSEGRVIQSLRYVFRAAGSDYVVFTETHDSMALAWAVPHILDFIDGIAPTETSR